MSVNFDCSREIGDAISGFQNRIEEGDSLKIEVSSGTVQLNVVEIGNQLPTQETEVAELICTPVDTENEEGTYGVYAQLLSQDTMFVEYHPYLVWMPDNEEREAEDLGEMVSLRIN
jgi:hypothetical protein